MATHTRLLPNATLRDVVPTLDKKVDFVARAYGKMIAYTQSHGSVALRLGVSAGSKGKRPNYCIDYAGTEKHIAAIDGNTHEPWKGADASAHGNWSSAAMALAQVQELLSELRAEGRPGNRIR